MALDQVLHRLRLDQVDVARGIDVSRVTVGNWVHGRATPQGRNLAALLAFLQRYDDSLTLNDLLSSPESTEPAAEVPSHGR